jgi:Na+-exporting ATPase
MTGMATELGKIAEALENEQKSNKTGFRLYLEKVRRALGIEGTTPLQIKLNKLAYWVLFIACILAIIVVSSTGYHDIPNSIAIYAVAAAVSLLPASLIAVVSLTLAVACQDLAKRNALVRRMDAVETLCVPLLFQSHNLSNYDSGVVCTTFAQIRLGLSQLEGWFSRKCGPPLPPHS